MKALICTTVLLCGIACSNSKAADNYDQLYLESGALDNQFKIINYDKYVEVTRRINNEFAKRLPAQVDNATTYTMVKLSRAGLNVSLQLKGVESREDLENTLDERAFKRAMMNRVCQMSFINSNFFKKTTKGDISYEINSFDFKKLKTYEINQKDCLNK